MCGRFALVVTPDLLEDAFAAAGVGDFPPRYNIAPTQPILMLVAGERREQGSNLPERTAVLVRWGLIPSWVKDPGRFALLFNARGETANDKASFRAAMRHRRTLVPASGFYEWRREGGKRAQPFWVRPRAGGVIAFAGLMETWLGADGSEIDTGAIVTTNANVDTAHIHERMPVVIQSKDFARWLDCRGRDPRDVADLLRPVEPGFFEAIPVSNLVNKVANTAPAVQERLSAATEAAQPQPAQLSLL
jgi:putative SOS response-associated peptidase YedK